MRRRASAARWRRRNRHRIARGNVKAWDREGSCECSGLHPGAVPVSENGRIATLGTPDCTQVTFARESLGPTSLRFPIDLSSTRTVSPTHTVIPSRVFCAKGSAFGSPQPTADPQAAPAFPAFPAAFRRLGDDSFQKFSEQRVPAIPANRASIAKAPLDLSPTRTVIPSRVFCAKGSAFSLPPPTADPQAAPAFPAFPAALRRLGDDSFQKFRGQRVPAIPANRASVAKANLDKLGFCPAATGSFGAGAISADSAGSRRLYLPELES